MQDFLDKNLLEICRSLPLFFARYYGLFVSMGKAIGGVLCLIVVASEAYQMMLLKKGIDVLALLRPVLISLVLMNWGSFTYALRQPFGDALENYAKNGIYQKEMNRVTQLYLKRLDIQRRQFEILQAARAKAKAAEESVGKGQEKDIFSEITSSAKDLFEKIVDIKRMLGNITQTVATSIIEGIMMLITSIIWNCAVLITFFGREVALGVLTITGPITFGMSVLPIWKDAWASWVTRYISFCLYGFVAFLVMAAALQLFRYGIEVDIKRLSTPGLHLGDFVHFNYIYSLLAAIVGWHGLRMVPEVVSWIVPTNSSQAVSRFVSGVNNTATSGVKTAAKAATAVV